MTEFGSVSSPVSIEWFMMYNTASSEIIRNCIKCTGDTQIAKNRGNYKYPSGIAVHYSRPLSFNCSQLENKVEMTRLQE